MKKILIYSKKYYDKKLEKLFPNSSIHFDLACPPVVYGAGVVGDTIIKTLAGEYDIRVKYVADKNKKLWGKKFGQATIISPDELAKNHKSEVIIIASVIYETEIYQELVEKGYKHVYPMSFLNFFRPNVFDYRDYNNRYQTLFKPHARKKIANTYNLMADKISKKVFSTIIDFRLKHYFNVQMNTILSPQEQYFDTSIINLGENEIFVDGGAFDGDTAINIMLLFGDKIKNIYSFEPDSKNYLQLIKNIKTHKLKNVILEKYGLYKNSGTVSFFGLGSPESGIKDQDNFDSWSGKTQTLQKNSHVISLSVVSLDDYFTDKKPPTFIKMDIEGAEIDALLGAKNLIKNYAPTLAICVYHKPTDLWEIPLLIHKLNPKYKFYLRHYSREICETVCYAIAQ